MQAVPILLPQLNSNDSECLVDRFYFETGALIQPGQAVFSMQTSKAALDVEAEASGYFAAAVEIPCRLQVGQTVGWICNTREQALAMKPPAPAKSKTIESVPVGAGPVLQRASKKAKISNLTHSLGAIYSSLTVQFNGQTLLQKAAVENWPVLTLSPLIILEVFKLLKKNTAFLSYANEAGLVVSLEPTIGIGVDIGNGLKVYALSLSEVDTADSIQGQIFDILKKETTKSATANDFRPVNFIVTDLSTHNVLQFQPVLSKNQGACLALGADKEYPGQPHTLTLAFDHRVLSGREVAIFLGRLKENILKY